MSKIGRNEPCPCGSGVKYKKCHGGIAPRPAASLPAPKPQFTGKRIEADEIPPAVRRMAALQQQQDLGFTRQYGNVRPPISADYSGYKFVVAGNKLLYQPVEKAQFFTDILLTFVPNTFGKEWFEAEVAKPRGLRHPVFEARYKAMTYIQKQPRSPIGTYAAQMTGPMLGYFTFAYDMFVVQDNCRLDGRLIERLKNCEMFQGARHELFAEATCLRAGFEIEHEDETDGSKRHAEFTATHRASRQKVSVEAKSKHRPGVLV